MQEQREVDEYQDEALHAVVDQRVDAGAAGRGLRGNRLHHQSPDQRKRAGDHAGTGISPWRLARPVLGFGLIVALGARIRPLLRVTWPAWAIFALLVLTLASQTWSVAPDISARRAVAVTFTVMFGVYLALREDRLDTLRAAGGAMFVAALFNLGAVLALPGASRGRSGSPKTGSPAEFVQAES